MMMSERRHDLDARFKILVLMALQMLLRAQILQYYHNDQTRDLLSRMDGLYDEIIKEAMPGG